MNSISNRSIFRRLSLLFFCILTASYFASAQERQPGSSAPPASEGKKAFEKLKTMTGSWQGTIMDIPITFTIRAASSRTAIAHEAHTPGGGPPNNEITMFYMEGERLLATHYCDAGNRTNLEGKLTPDGKGVDFNMIELIGSKRGGYLQRMLFTLIAADHQVAELSFVQPDGKPIPLRGEFRRTK